MKAIRFRLVVFLVLLIVIMFGGTLGFQAVEGLSFVDALYFSIVTIATVGYGDIHPVTQAGKLCAIVLIITGVGTFLGVIANATEMMLSKWETERRHQKLNMITGLFFGQVGTRLLTHFSDCDPNIGDIRKELIVTSGWSDRDFVKVTRSLKAYDYRINFQKLNLGDLRAFLTEKTSILLSLLENPVIVEHEIFSDLLAAVFHLHDELVYRTDFSHLPESDMKHLAGDVQRVYGLLVSQWMDYMKYLKNNYPYLFSLAIRTNPFDQEASPVVH
jgi:voltage-gated potassium channel